MNKFTNIFYYYEKKTLNCTTCKAY
uniref:Uncharacterized protein n=1 Tax=Rhizophora mucronata TaxID=61149 RepID=A0A2P2Q1M3_RHIMU